MLNADIDHEYSQKWESLVLAFGRGYQDERLDHKDTDSINLEPKKKR